MENSFIKTGVVVVTLSLISMVVALPSDVVAQMYYNVSPRWTPVANSSVIQGQTLNLAVYASDDNGDVLAYSSIQMPQNATFDGNNRVFSFTPSYNQLGSYPVTLSVTDN